ALFGMAEKMEKATTVSHCTASSSHSSDASSHLIENALIESSINRPSPKPRTIFFTLEEKLSWQSWELDWL
ncbi:hypothetical protein PMAYCL1PPCAC_03171, partial [Pristionchus mayeri]